MANPIVLGGQRVGRLRASFILFKETFRFFWADKEMLWVPIITSIMQLFLIGLLVITVVIPSGMFADVETETAALTPVEYAYVFLFYVIGAFTVACTQAAITHIVYTRVHGGNATLGSGLHAATAHAGNLFIWACITSTVGLVLRAIAERSAWLMKLLVAILGTAWSVLTYFVVPAIVIDQKSAFDAIGHSGTIFKRTWGETIVTNISFSLAILVSFFVLVVVLIGLMVVSGGAVEVLFVCGGIFIVAILIIILLSSVLDSVLRTLLYVYANEGTVPQNFNRELLESMLARTQVVAETPNQTTV